MHIYNWSLKILSQKVQPLRHGQGMNPPTAQQLRELPSLLHLLPWRISPPAHWNSQGKNAFSFYVLGKRPATPAPKTPEDLHRKSCGLNWFDFLGWQTFQCSVWMHAGPVYKLNKKMIQGFLIPKWLAREKSGDAFKVIFWIAPGEQTWSLQR